MSHSEAMVATRVKAAVTIQPTWWAAAGQLKRKNLANVPTLKFNNTSLNKRWWGGSMVDGTGHVAYSRGGRAEDPLNKYRRRS